MILKNSFISSALLLSLPVSLHASDQSSKEKPNIIIILTDDLGYGATGCYGSTQLKTPNIDRLAREGMRFIDAHSPASVSTPSRYNLLTGRYCWRPVAPENRKSQLLQWDKVPGFTENWIGHVATDSNEPLLINDGRMTVASLLRANGYSTACVGKWNLGFCRPGTTGWNDTVGPDWNLELKPGPLEVGFDYYFGVPTINNSTLTVFVENHRVYNFDPTDPIRLEAAFFQGGRINLKMTGGQKARFEQNHLDDVQTAKAITWLEQVSGKEKPFFLYLALCSPHYPYAPSPKYKGTSELGAYGDAIHEADGSVGEILATLDKLKLTDNTIVIFTSDNGDNSHKSSQPGKPNFSLNGPLRGVKTEVYEGGHRIPFIVRWPGHIRAASTSDQMVANTDLLATFADMVKQPLPDNAGEDSFSFLPVLLGKEGGPLSRKNLVNDSMTGQYSIREGLWKLILGQGGGGFAAAVPKTNEGAVNAPAGQLYNLGEDLTELHNLYNDHPEIVRRLTAQFEQIEKSGRSRPEKENLKQK